jgi:nucleoid DNA-binding protein
MLQPEMNKPELAKQLGRERGVPTGDAADQMDRTVNQIVRALRKGTPARLPGLGTIIPGKRWTLKEDRD